MVLAPSDRLVAAAGEFVRWSWPFLLALLALLALMTLLALVPEIALFLPSQLM